MKSLWSKVHKLAKQYNKDPTDTVSYLYELETHMAYEERQIDFKVNNRIKQEAYEVVENYLKTGEGWMTPYNAEYQKQSIR